MIHFHAANTNPLFAGIPNIFSRMAAYDTKRRHMSGHVSPPGLSTAGNDAGQDAPGPPAGFILPISGNISLLLTGRKNDGIKRS